MTFRIHFTSETSANVSSTYHSETSDRGAHYVHLLDGVKIQGDKLEGFYYNVGKEILDVAPDTIPEGFRGYVKSVSVTEYVSLDLPRRTFGEYRHKSAKARVEPQRGGGNYRYIIYAEAANLADLQALVRSIIAGTILPDFSYEGTQADPSVAELLKSVQGQRCQALTYDLERAHQVIAGFDAFYESAVTALAKANATIAALRADHTAPQT